MKFFSIARLLAASSLFMLTLFLFSCQKESSIDEPAANTEADAALIADESTQADGVFDDLDEIGQVTAEEDDYAATEAGTGGRYLPTWIALRAIIGAGGTVTVSPIDGTFPKTITIDFGDSTVGGDAKVRSGKVIVHITAPRRKPGSVVTVTLVNYSLNNVKIEGTKIVSNISTGTTLRYSAQLVDGKVTFPNGRGYTMTGVKVREQIAGQSTPIVLDNVFNITGYTNVNFFNGAKVRFDIVDPLVKKVTCPWRSDGTVKIKVNDNFTAKLDYGFPNNGDCDRKALLSWNNNQRVVLLP